MDISQLKLSPTYLNLPENTRNEWIKKVQSFPPGWIKKPYNGQIFESSTDCLDRLNAYGFLEGCLFVIGRRGGTKESPTWYMRCKFHGARSLNVRKLESRVERDEDSNIVTQRKRDTRTKKRDCPVLYYLHYRMLDRATKDRAFIGKWREEEHQNHSLHLNPFSFAVHEQSTDMHQVQIAAASRFRAAKQPYSMALLLLKEDSNGVFLGKKRYYNLTAVRRSLPKKEDDRTIAALLQGLKEDGFRFATRTEDSYEEQRDGTLKLSDQKLVQIFFYHPECVHLAQRFTAGHALIVDGTFNTNKLRLPLLVAVGITNEEKTFPIAFSFCPGETAESYNFFFDCLRSDIFTDGVVEPKVVMGDMGAGLLSSIDTFNSMPHSSFQICSWHAVEAMLAYFHKVDKYTTAELEGPQDDKDKKTSPGLLDWCWDYIQSPTLDELKKNRQNLWDHLQESEQAYMKNNWGPKESRTVYCYIRLLLNLGVSSSQRVESYHRLLKDVVSGHMSLQDSTKAICRRVTNLVIQLRTEEDNALMNTPLALDQRFFKYLIGQISLAAIKKIETEWLQMAALLQSGEELGSCDTCDILHRYSLPCRHYLRRAYDEGTPIPRSLIHPRWWLRGPVIKNSSWNPSYHGIVEPMPSMRPSKLLSRSEQTLLPYFHSIIRVQEQLPEGEQARFGRKVIEMSTNLLNEGREREETALLPIQNPDSVKWKFFKKKGGLRSDQNSRGMTANELAKAADKKAQQKSRQAIKDASILRSRSQQFRNQTRSSMQTLLQAQADRENEKKIEALKAENAARQKQMLAERTIPITTFTAPGAIQPAATLTSHLFQHNAFVQRVLEEGQKEKEAAAAHIEREKEEEEERAYQETLRIEAQNIMEAALKEEARAFVRTQRADYEAKKRADVTRLPSPPLTNLGEQSRKLAQELKRLKGVIKERRGFEPTSLPHQVEARERLQEELEERCNAVYEVLEEENTFTSDGRAPPIHLWDGGKDFTDPICARNFETDAHLPIPESPRAATPPAAPAQTGSLRFNFPSWMKPAPPSLPPPPPQSNEKVVLPPKRKRDTRKLDEALTNLAPKKRKT